MEITIVTQDTRGGVQPYAALAKSLVEAGHGVRAVAPADLAWLFERVGVSCLSLDGMSSEDSKKVALEVQGDRFGALRRATQAIAERVPGWAIEVRRFAEGSDILTGGVGGSVLGVPVASSLGVPWVPAHLQPVGMPNTRYPGVLMPGLPRLAGAGNLVGQLLTEAAIRLPFLPAQRAAARALGRSAGSAPKLQGSVYGISPSVIQAPARRSHDRVVTGYWFDAIDADEALPPEVEDFLAHDSTDPVVSIGFGSMVAPDPEGLRGLLVDAARSAGARVVLIAGAGALGDQSARDGDVLVVPSIPHRALFHRMNANVHHGGAGTTANALAAGVPSVVVPFGADQPFWARRAADLGVAPPPIPISRLTRERFSDALRLALSDPTMRSQSAGLGARIRSENGTAEAAQWYGRLRG